MDFANPLIVSVVADEYKKIVIEASDGIRYFADLSSFEKVYCFPRTKELWHKVSPDSSGLTLIWTTRFEVHVDQVLALAYKQEPIAKSA